MQQKTRWGLMGAGRIVNRWMNGALQLNDTEIVAVASRTYEKAYEISKKYGIECSTSYLDLVTRNDIDVVYIPVPHVAHKDLAILAMEHGKSVLVEKPAAVNSIEWQAMVDCAKKNKVFLMEAMWTRFFPLLNTLNAVLHEKVIGDVEMIHVSFSFRLPEQLEKSRMMNPDQAGGALLDLGVYVLTFCDIVMNEQPLNLTGFAAFELYDDKNKTDVKDILVAEYKNSAMASMTIGFRTDMPDTGFIYGSKGHIEIPNFWKPTTMYVVTKDNSQHYNMPVDLQCFPFPDEGYQYEISHVNRCLQQGRLSSDIMTHDKTMQILKACDALRKQWSYEYPFEKDTLK